jgi:hypothetical protein
VVLVECAQREVRFPDLFGHEPNTEGKETQMRIKSKEELEKCALAFIEASQRVKAAQDVLKHQREAIIPAFNQFCRPDTDGNRTLEFGPTKIMLVPSREVDEQLLRDKLGSDVHRFTTRYLTIALHTIQGKLGEGSAMEVESAVREIISRKVGDEPTLIKNSVRVVKELDVDAALASLPRDDQKKVKVETNQTLRPYPEKQGFGTKLKAAIKWLRGE